MEDYVPPKCEGCGTQTNELIRKKMPGSGWVCKYCRKERDVWIDYYISQAKKKMEMGLKERTDGKCLIVGCEEKCAAIFRCPDTPLYPYCSTHLHN